jgi:hypothetical protein
MAFIGCGEININLLPLLLGCIFCFLNRILNQYKDTLLLKNIVLTNIFISFADFFMVIPYIIFRKRSETEVKDENVVNYKKTSSSGNLQVDYIYNQGDSQNVEGIWKYIIFSAIIFFITSIIFVYTVEIKTNSWILYILSTSIFYYLIFKVKLYKHHYLSIIIIILMGIIIDLVAENLQNEIVNKILKLLLSFIRIIALSLYYVLAKYIMEKKFASIYEVILSNGLINFILFIIFAVIDYYCFGLYDYANYFKNFNIAELFVALGVMITQLGMYVCILSLNKRYSPCHSFIIFLFGQLAYHFYNFEFKGSSIAIIICMLIMLLFSLIFSEIVEIYFWGLSYNLKRSIMLRAENETNDDSLNKADTFDINSQNSIELRDSINSTTEEE